MARIYTKCEMFDEAIGELELVLSQEEDVTVNTFKLSSWIDPIRDNPNYQNMIKQYALP